MASGFPASADIFVGSRHAMRIASAAGGLSPMKRAQIIADRMNKAFAAGATWSDMKVARVGNYTIITARNMPIATIDPTSACLFGVTPNNLASRWLKDTRLAMQSTVRSRVAGSQQQIGSMCTAYRNVPLINASTGSNIGNINIAGSTPGLDTTGSVVVYQSTSGNATVYTFVPVDSATGTGTLTRSAGVGVYSVPQSMLPTSTLMTGANVSTMVGQMGTQWNSTVNSNLGQQNLQFSADMNTKVVPLYAVDSGQAIGAAQVAGSDSAVSQTQSVAVTAMCGDMWQLTPSSSAAPTATLIDAVANVGVSSIIEIPQSSTAPTETAPAY